MCAFHEDDVSKEPAHKSHSTSLPSYVPTMLRPGRTGFELMVSEYELLAFQFAFMFAPSVSDCYLLKPHSNRGYPSGSLNSQQSKRIQKNKSDIPNA